MNITVFGASGGTGTHLVTLAAERGHQVRAIYRATPQDPPPRQAEILISPRTSSIPPAPPQPSAAQTWWSPSRPQLRHPP